MNLYFAQQSRDESRVATVTNSATRDVRTITMWYVYLLRCADESFYAGTAKDLVKRVERHNSGRGGKYTRAKRPVSLIYAEDFSIKSEALKREIEIKKLSKVNKEKLVKFGRGHRFPSGPEV